MLDSKTGYPINNVVPVILCGGVGTRLHPLSTPEYPKQFLRIEDQSQTQLQKTVLRALEGLGCNPSHIVTVTGTCHVPFVQQQYEVIDSQLCTHILGEPAARNTAPAIALAAHYISEVFGHDSVMVVMPTDHIIHDLEALRSAIETGCGAAQDGYIVTIGLLPKKVTTEYGYIQKGHKADQNCVFHVKSFAEKPDTITAQKFITNGNYLWNSGIFIFQTKSIISAIEKYLPTMNETFKKHKGEVLQNKALPEAAYHGMSHAQFDQAILEKSDQIKVVEGHFDWMDIGTWAALITCMNNRNINDHRFETGENHDREAKHRSV